MVFGDVSGINTDGFLFSALWMVLFCSAGFAGVFVMSVYGKLLYTTAGLLSLFLIMISLIVSFLCVHAVADSCYLCLQL